MARMTSRTIAVIVSAFFLNACSVNSSAPRPVFWDPANSVIYGKLSSEQEGEAVRLTRDFIALLDLLKDFALEEQVQLASLRTSDPSTPLPAGDFFTVTEITLRCQRHNRGPVSERAAIVRGIHFEGRDGNVCPVDYAAGMQTVQGPFQGGISRKREFQINFAAKPGTVIYDQGSIRAFSIGQIERVFERPYKSSPPTPGQRLIDKGASGALTIRTGERVPFSIKRMATLAIAKAGDSREFWTGRDETTVTLAMPGGTLEVTTDLIYNGKSASPIATVTVNGRDVSK